MSIPNQVFIGCPWKGILPKYEAAIPKLQQKYPIGFAIVGRGDSQDAKDLFDIIKRRILNSSFSVFDATGGNANVSLEYGFAEALCTYGKIGIKCWVYKGEKKPERRVETPSATAVPVPAQ